MYTVPLTSSHPPSLPSSVLLHTAGHVVAVLSTTDFTLRLLASRTLMPLQPYLALTPPRLPVLSDDTVHNSHYSLLTSLKASIIHIQHCYTSSLLVANWPFHQLNNKRSEPQFSSNYTLLDRYVCLRLRSDVFSGLGTRCFRRNTSLVRRFGAWIKCPGRTRGTVVLRKQGFSGALESRNRLLCTLYFNVDLI